MMNLQSVFGILKGVLLGKSSGGALVMMHKDVEGVVYNPLQSDESQMSRLTSLEHEALGK